MKETYEMIIREMKEITDLIKFNKSSLMDAIERNDLKSAEYFLRIWESYQEDYRKCLEKMDKLRLRFRAI